MDVWKCFFLSLCYKSLIVRPRNRFISQDYDVYVYAHIFTIQNFVAVFVPLMPLAWCCTSFIERLQHLNFLPASLFLQRQVNFLNQINDNRNKIDMLLLLLLLLQTNWVQIFLSDGCKAHNRLEKKALRCCYCRFAWDCVCEWSWHLIHLIARFITLSLFRVRGFS